MIMNNIILIIFILFLINLFLFCFIIFKLNKIIKYFYKYDLEHIQRDINEIQLNIKFLRNISEQFWTEIDKMSLHIYTCDAENNEVTLL